MNTTPFSLLHTTFRPEDAREDKIDLEAGAWAVYGLGPEAESERTFKSYLSSPPEGAEDMAWQGPGKLSLFGWLFLRPEMKGKDWDKLKFRKQSLKHPTKPYRLEGPLCGGSLVFRRDNKLLVATGDTIHRAWLRVSLNMPRFVRHQPPKDDPSHWKPWKNHFIRRRADNRSFHGEEFSLDGNDNWLPDTLAWRQFEKTVSFQGYLDTVFRAVDDNFRRVCKVASGLLLDDRNGWDAVVGGREGEHYSVSAVETFWEFRSRNPIGDVFQLGEKLMHLKKQGGEVTHYRSGQASRVLNAPCFAIPVAEDVELKLYAKTNHRIRFEIVQKKLRGERNALLTEAGVSFDKTSRPLEELPIILGALRQRAAKHMQRVMEELREGRDGKVNTCSIVDLLAVVSSAVPPSPPEEHHKRLEQIQLLLHLLCHQKGFRGSIKEGPYAASLNILKKRGVIYYDRPRQFYVLAPEYVSAADSFTSPGTAPPLSANTAGAIVRPLPKLRSRASGQFAPQPQPRESILVLPMPLPRLATGGLPKSQKHTLVPVLPEPQPRKGTLVLPMPLPRLTIRGLPKP